MAHACWVEKKKKVVRWEISRVLPSSTQSASFKHEPVEAILFISMCLTYPYYRKVSPILRS